MKNGDMAAALMEAREEVWRARAELLRVAREGVFLRFDVLFGRADADGLRELNALRAKCSELWARLDELTAQVRQADFDIEAEVRRAVAS